MNKPTDKMLDAAESTSAPKSVESVEGTDSTVFWDVASGVGATDAQDEPGEIVEGKKRSSPNSQDAKSADLSAASTLSGFDFAPRSGVLAAVLVVVVLAVAIASANGSAMVTTAVAAATAITGGYIALAQQRRRWKLASTAYRMSQSLADSWHQQLAVLHDNSEQSETALSQMIDGVVMLSFDGKILLINEAACALFGLSSDVQYLSRPFVEVVRIPETTKALRTAQQGEVPQTVTVEIAEGANVRPVRVRLDQTSERANSNILLTIRDETESHRVEAMRREFVANVSHEIKTPIAAIKGYVETAELAMDDDHESAVRFLGQINGQCLRLERLVADMMQIARAQSGQQYFHITAVDWSDIVSEVMRSLMPVAESRGITITIDDIQDAVVTADHQATLAIASNLIGNAIHYTPRGGNVRIRCRRDEYCVAFVVEDDGVGIAAADQDRIFERFYRVDRTRNSASGGTGIGLAIVKNLTNAQNGKIHVESTPGNGATFEVQLPLAPEVRQSEHEAAAGDRVAEGSSVLDGGAIDEAEPSGAADSVSDG